MTDSASALYDVAVIGAGVVGCAIARELARYELRCVLVESKGDIGAGTSKANTAILHTGYDGKPGFLETQLVRRGYELLNDFAPQAGIPLEHTGALLVAWSEEQLQALPTIGETALENGVIDVQRISIDELYRLEPHLGRGALGALKVPGESIICPFTPPLAYATQAVINGVDLCLNSHIRSIEETGPEYYLLHRPQGAIRCRYIVNAAGLFSDSINAMMGHSEFQVTPRRGELIVYDKMARSLVNHILMPVPTKTTKGVMIAPTVFGNVLLGPTAEDLQDKTATDTTAAGLSAILDKGHVVLPELVQQEVTTTYAGLRAATQHGDYQIFLHADQRYLCVGGIRSTGLTASMAIAEYAVQQLSDAGLSLRAKAEFLPVHMPNIGEACRRPYQSDEMIHSNPDYGRIVCHCERVTKGEIVDAARSWIPAKSVGALGRRTRAQLGRCQGFFCSAEVATLLAEASGQSLKHLLGVPHEDH
jgi:glycerol-3-phosphate dehydrogenase